VRIIEGLSDKERDNSVNEVRILASIKNNNNVIRYYEAFMDHTVTHCPYLCIIMEYADSGDLFLKIQQYQKDKETFQENELWKLII
jgi:serine/threonine protein kinase